MTERAFVVMQIGATDSPERRRADEIYRFIIEPALKEFDLEPYRADLDASPGPITQKLLSELINARLVIADLTGRNPNVYYELGVAHTIVKPLIAIADSASSLPFDTKDERIIALGEYAATGLTYAQGERAKADVLSSLRIVMDPDYDPPSPIKDLAASRSIDSLAPDNPMAAELQQIREAVEELRRGSSRPRRMGSDVEELTLLRKVLERNIGALDQSDFSMLIGTGTSSTHDEWVDSLQKQRPTEPDDDPWKSAPVASRGYSDVPPF